jgi:ribonucleotide monophosphatase NagD (HAD superfamily)
MLAAIEASSGGHAEAIVGKPSEHMAATVLERLGFAPDDTVLVGDRLLTDVRMARRAGMHAALVLTGATSPADLDASAERPDFVLTDVTELIPI